MKYAWIRAHCDSFSVAAMCRSLRVSTSGYYKWLNRKPSPRAERSKRIRDAVRQVHTESHQIYGSYKIADRLRQDDQLESACRNTVARAMREMGLKSRVSRKFKPTTTITDPAKKAAPNLLDQVFSAEAPGVFSVARNWV